MHVAQRQRAVLLQQQHPGPERGGHAGRQQAVAGHQVKPQPPERPQRGTARRRSLAVQHETPPCPVPAPPGRRRSRSPGPRRRARSCAARRPGAPGRRRPRRRRRCRRLQHGHAGRGGQPVSGRHHAEGARELRPGGERGALRHHRRSLGCAAEFCGGLCGGVAPAGIRAPVPSSSRGRRPGNGGAAARHAAWLRAASRTQPAPGGARRKRQDPPGVATTGPAAIKGRDHDIIRARGPAGRRRRRLLSTAALAAACGSAANNSAGQPGVHRGLLGRPAERVRPRRRAPLRPRRRPRPAARPCPRARRPA